VFRVAHISDLHIPPLPHLRPRELLGKRLLGLYSWRHKWRGEHRSEVLAALRDLLDKQQPDHICVTGDLTFTGHPAELDAAARWLEALAESRRISLVPGNHDVFMADAVVPVRERWAQWMRDDDGEQRFPYLHRRGPLDIIGLSSAVPTPPAVTRGRLGEVQLAAVEALLSTLSAQRRPRLLLLHHPPHEGAARSRKALADRVELRQVLACVPVSLVLHGHLHRPERATVAGPEGPIPVLGAASGSALGRRYTPAHCHLLEFAPGQDTPTVRHAHFDPAAGRFGVGPSGIL